MRLVNENKRHINTRKIKRWKARLTVDGSIMTKCLHYDKVYAPVDSCTSICLLLTIIGQIDYVQEFPQALAKKNLYLTVPVGFEVEGGKKGDYALR